MSQIEKLYKKFLTQPETLKYHELEKVLVYLNFERIEAKGSHVKFKHRKLTFDIVIPLHKNDCKNFYKKQARNQITSLITKI